MLHSIAWYQGFFQIQKTKLLSVDNDINDEKILGTNLKMQHVKYFRCYIKLKETLPLMFTSKNYSFL